MASELARRAAEKARDAAEEFFNLGNIEMAIRSVTAAAEFDPELPHVDDYLAAYKVHDMASKKKTWYEILAICDTGVDCGIIKKQYKKYALKLHPDKNRSIAANGAFKIIQSALEVLTNPNQRKAYDSGFSSCKRTSKPTPPPSGNVNRRTSKPSPTASSKAAPKRQPASSNAGKRKADSHWSQTRPQAADRPSASSSGFRNNDSSESCHRRIIKIQQIKISGGSGSRVDVVSRDSNDRVIFTSTCIQKPGDFIQIF